MSAYLPNSWTICGLIWAILIGETLVGFFLTRIRVKRFSRLLSWLMTIACAIGVERLTATEPPGLRMVAIILAVLYGMKAVVTIESAVRLSPLRWLGFSWLWFGMRPSLFTHTGEPSLPGSWQLLLRGLTFLPIGAGAMLLARAIWEARDWLGDNVSRWSATVPLLVGFSLLLHFGVFNVLAAFWRSMGVDCRPLFKAPILSKSLSEFWSKRWNLAFSEMTSVAVYRPISAVAGRRVAILASFVASGLVHEVAISVPVLAGFGGPSLYFLLHGFLVLVETRLSRAGFSIESRPWLGRVWTLTAVVLPLPILFHPPFLAGVAWPIAGISKN